MTPEQLKALTDAIRAEVEKGHAANFEALSKMVTEHKAEVQKALDKQAEVQRAFSLPGSADATHKGEKFSFAKFYRGVWTGKWDGAGMEHAIAQETTNNVKAMGLVPDSTGGFAVPTEITTNDIIPLLYAQSVLAQLGARTLTGLTAAPLVMPKVSGGTTAYWLSEAASITDSQLTLEQISMTPKTLATITPYSELLNVLQPAIESMIREDQAAQMALKLDLAGISGTGGGQPLGLVNWVGVGTESGAGSAPTYDKLQNMIADVENANALLGNLGWALSVLTKTRIKQAKDETGGTDNKSNIQPLGNREMWNEQAKTICGYKQAATTQLGTNDLIFGNWSDLLIGQWGGMMVDVSNQVGFRTAQKHLRTLAFFDTAVRRPASFSIAT